MNIVIFGKTGCSKCESAKQKMKLMRLKYTYIALDNPENWKEFGPDSMSEIMMTEIDVNTQIPVFVIDGEPLLYTHAMKILKGK